jgi:hypothetical protein
MSELASELSMQRGPASESMSQRPRPARELASAPSMQCSAKLTERSEGMR